ncbi:carboxypeptidase regulatory-like domain-containing protein [Opitutales bacterium]|nr:carboxypeptidase regulatory-like domain-containing protein [Opitutales bacterium]
MKQRITLTILAFALSVSLADANEIRGKVTKNGKGVEGVFVSAHDMENRKASGVFTAADGTYVIDELRVKDYRVRARQKGLIDVWLEDITAGSTGIEIKMTNATGWKLERQRTADSAFGMLKFDDVRDKLNFKMFCAYCHQIGTVGFRTPEEPVDWETMIRRMDGFGGLYSHTKRTIVKRIMDSYTGEAVDNWPKYVPPPPPTGAATKAKITWWEMGKRYESQYHDIDLTPDGRLIYAVNITKNYIVTVDTKTDKQVYKKFPRGSYGAHSIEPDNDGHMWVTMCASGQMAKYDIHNKEIEVYSSAEAPARRGGYPHTLRVNPKDPEGLIWYTDAGRNSVFWIHPKTKKVKEYHLLSANQAVAAGKGESKGITPYGIDFSPVDGMIWYSKLNGNRIGRIDPSKLDGDVKEWNPPFRGPRRLHIAPDGIIWVPGFGSGVFGKFDPDTQKWLVYDLPNKDNQIPYALNVAPNGHVWICGTGNDTIHRFNPKTEMLVTYPLPNRVSYTREIEFDTDGNVWTPTSGPSRHMETGYGAIIKIEPNDSSDSGGIKLKGYMPDRSKLTYEQPRRINYNGSNAKLLTRIAKIQLPQAYLNGKHQPYVDARMKNLTNQQKHRIHILWQELRKSDPDMPNAGQSFVRIMEYVAKNEK